jgi:serine/threonine-protein kinase
LELGYGRVTFDAKLGEGATAIVWRGELTPAPHNAHLPVSTVAVKALRPERRGEAARAFFLNEAETLRGIDHPNVVRLIDVVSPGSDDIALLFEYVEGETLESLLARQVARARESGTSSIAGVTYGFAWSVFDNLLSALGATHASGRVHADVKPANVLLRTDTIAKLTDFGLSRRMGIAAPAGEAGAGTAAYIPPEQVLGHPLDARSDLYSAGAVLYELLAGRTAFDTQGRTEIAVRMDQLHSQPPPLRTHLPDAPPALDGLLQRAMAKDPRARFSNANEMRDAFGTILQLAGRVHGRRR